ncbi:MAG: spore coat protein [Clostridia bacterium]|nr:spore coat protein [Clostridia bacterium]
MLDDRQLMENLLLNLKGECDLLMHGAVESSTPQVHTAFSKAFNDTLKMQSDVYAAMAGKGWYPSTKAEQQQIDTLKQKYSSGC